MVTSEGRISNSSISNLEDENSKFHFTDVYSGSVLDVPQVQNVCSSGSRSLRPEYPYQFPNEYEDFLDEEYDSSEDYSNSMQQNTPKVNLKNVLSGIVAIVTGRNKDSNASVDHQFPSSNVSFLGSAKNGDTFLHSSVYIPSAPPLLEPDGINYIAYKEVLEADPRTGFQTVLLQFACNAILPSQPLLVADIIVDFVEGSFVRLAQKEGAYYLQKFRERNPQRVCDTCYDRLDPLQSVLINTISNAVQTAKHDVVDWTCTRGWLNLPVGLSMEHEIYKSSSTLRSYSQVARLNPEKSIPSAVLKGAKGLAILTVAKAGVLLAYKLGTGLVIARRSDGSWSAPSAILSVGLGWGAQVGGELMDFIIVLHDSKAVKTFCSRMHFSLGAGCSAAAGPVGRVLEADFRAGERGSGMCYTYSCSKGAFVGVSLEGNIVATRLDTNLHFYGDPYLTTADILVGTVDSPKAAEPLYAALDGLYSKLGC